MSKKWQTVSLLALAEFLAMSLWFSASAVTPALTEAWSLDSGGVAWLTMSVQIGFVVGAFLSALLNVADVWRPRLVFALGAFLGAIANGVIALFVSDLAAAIVFRFITGFALAAVYPVGMKIMATWMKRDRGLGLGLLVGALTLGSASPHLLRAFGGINDWQTVMYLASGLAVLAGVIGLWAGELGPHRAVPAPFKWGYILEAVRDRGVRLANFGYLGHMWELYAAWTFLALFLSASYQRSGVANFETRASIMTFFRDRNRRVGQLIGRLAGGPLGTQLHDDIEYGYQRHGGGNDWFILRRQSNPGDSYCLDLGIFHCGRLCSV